MKKEEAFRKLRHDGFTVTKQPKHYKGYEVYFASRTSVEAEYLGPPLYILVENGDARYALAEEALEIHIGENNGIIKRRND